MKITEKHLNKLVFKYGWNHISKKTKLPMNLIEKYLKYLDLEIIFTFQNLTESFIEKYAKHDLHWHHLSACQNLSENFLIKHKHKIHWYNVYFFNRKVTKKKITNGNITYHKLYDNIRLYTDNEKTKRYLFLKNVDYIKVNYFLITFD